MGGRDTYATLGMAQREDDETVLRLFASYAYSERKHLANRFTLGEGMIGQAALEKKRILITDVPTGYIMCTSSIRYTL